MRVFVLLLFIVSSFHSFSQLGKSILPKIISIDNVSKANGALITAFFLKNDEIKKLEKFEVGFQLPKNFQTKIKGFFEGTSKKEDWINPFNRHDIDITLNFYVNGILEKTIDAFYYEEYKIDSIKNNWIIDTTSFNFRARFSPQKTGEYQVKVSISAKNCDSLLTKFSFNVIDGISKGYLEKGIHGRHFSFSETKKSFIGVGQVIPWSEAHNGKMDEVNRPSDFVPFYKALKAMDKAGGNFTRFIASPWFMELEWEALGNYQPKLGQAWEFDRITEECETNELYYIFCSRLHTQLENHADENYGLRWENNCYNDKDVHPAVIAHEPKIGISKVIEFYSNEIAKDHNKNYLRYLISRWGYSNAIAGWQVMSEIDNTQGYSSDTLTQKEARNWTHEMIRYINNKLDDPHLLSVAVANPKGAKESFYDPEIYNIPEIDFIGLHSYVYEVAPPTGIIRNRNLADRYKAINEIGIGMRFDSLAYPSFNKKLFIFDEFGQVSGIPKDWPSKDNTDPTVEYNNEIGFMLKQDLWFSVMSGSAISGLDWWNYSSLKRQEDWLKYYKGIIAFFEGIDFEKVNYTNINKQKGKQFIAQRWPFTEKEINRSNKRNYSKDDMLEAHTQTASDGSQAFGWMSNRSVNWMNLINDLPVLKQMLNGELPYSKKYLYLPKDDDKVTKSIDLEGDKYFIKVYFLQRKSEYMIDFYNTISGQKIASDSLKSNSKGEVKIFAPEMKWIENPDIAFKLYLKDSTFK